MSKHTPEPLTDAQLRAIRHRRREALAEALREAERELSILPVLNTGNLRNIGGTLLRVAVALKTWRDDERGVGAAEAAENVGYALGAVAATHELLPRLPMSDAVSEAFYELLAVARQEVAIARGALTGWRDDYGEVRSGAVDAWDRKRAAAALAEEVTP